MDSRQQNHATSKLAALALAITPFIIPISAAAADADAAQRLARQNNCFKCHAVDKSKVGPAWNEIAKKLKGNPDAEAILVKHLTTGPKDHPIIKAKSPDDTKNLANWILSL